MLKAALLALLSVPSAALTQEFTHNSVSFGPRIAMFRAVGANDTRWGSIGGQLRVPFGSMGLVEFSVDRARYHAQGTDVHVTPIQATLIGFLYDDRAFSPYVLLGLGRYNVRADGPFNNPHRRYGPHVGAGAEIFISQYLSVDGSWRYLWTQIHELKLGGFFGRDFRKRGDMFTLAVNYRL